MFPKGFYSYSANIGIKDSSLDFAVIYSEKICNSACMFTKNNYPGAPILVGREHAKNSLLQAIVINSKNSNVANGEKGIEHALETCKVLGENLGIEPNLILPSSTGVIGVPLPIEKILNACSIVKENLSEGNLNQVAKAIMTTDTKEKISFKKLKTDLGEGVIYGIAKGAGMIEPNMATMLVYILTDITVDENLYPILKSSVDKSFHCLTIDSDTSTSDTVAILSNGLMGFVDKKKFQEALNEICIDLAKKIARDGEGASKLIELKILESKSDEQASKIGKSILNSPLIKTAIYGGDPNWGRFVMAIGKVFDEPIPFENLKIRIGDLEVKNANPDTLKKMSEYLKSNDTIYIYVHLGVGEFSKTFWSCDFTEKYIEENAFYTT
jgi:glutamate N-acetyltransferase / amino-acid N-acetyltransferase